MDQIVERLYTTQTESMKAEARLRQGEEKKPGHSVSEAELSSIIDRLYSTPTKSATGCHPDLG